MIWTDSATIRRVLVFGTVVIVALAVGIGYIVARAAEIQQARRPTAETSRDLALPLGDVLAVPHVVFRSTSPGPTYGKLAAVPLADPRGPRAASDLDCERVYAAAAGGVCVTGDRGLVTTYQLSVLDARMRPRLDEALNGLPSRARMSADGTWAATTMFVSGHSYAGGAFATETVIRDLGDGHDLGNLQDWRITVNGRVTTAVDLNVWGVTFATGPRPDRFYATVATGGHRWLAEGSIAARTLRTVRQGVECPSLAPDNRRIAFKSRAVINGRTGWRLVVLDLRSGKTTTLGETRSVDDQPEWLDDQHVLYGLQRQGSPTSDVWSAPLDGRPPRVLIPRAWSPSVVRTPAPSP